MKGSALLELNALCDPAGTHRCRSTISRAPSLDDLWVCSSASKIQAFVTALKERSGSLGVYTLMNIYVFFHSLLPRVPESRCSVIAELLCGLDPPVLRSKFENYLHDTLMKPYKQYLVKALQCRSVKDNGYVMYNLLVLICHAFKKPLRELSSFLEKEYPQLIEYRRLLLRDAINYHPLVEGVIRSRLNLLEVEEMISQLHQLKGADDKQLKAPDDKQLDSTYDSSLRDISLEPRTPTYY